MTDSTTEEITREYYNSQNADRFYDSVWGGEDIHIGLYEGPGDSIFQASRRTVEKMRALLPPVPAAAHILDLGAGYGGSARYLTREFGCKVTCLNLSEVQNVKNRAQNREAQLSPRIDVVDGSFEEIPFPQHHFDLVWSQDAILHSGKREQVLREVDRVLKPGGHFIFTDPMQSDDCPGEALQPVLERIHLSSLGSPGFYRQAARQLGWKELLFLDLSPQLPNHYQAVHDEILRREPGIFTQCDPDYIERMKAGLMHWVANGKAGRLKWGIFLFQKGSA